MQTFFTIQVYNVKTVVMINTWDMDEVHMKYSEIEKNVRFKRLPFFSTNISLD
jgi:hypothetical protein